MKKIRSQDEIMNSWKNNTEGIMISICCLTYNHGSYLKDALHGFLSQETSYPFEILIHDDASTDDTQEIIREYEKRYPKLINAIYQVENQYSKGLRSINLKFNYSRAKGKYIALCEGDDYWTDKSKLQKQIESLERLPDCTLCIHATSVLNLSNEGVLTKKIRLNYGDKKFKPEEVILGGGNFGQTSSFVFRRNIVENVPRWFINAPSGDTSLRLLCAHKGFVYYLDEEMSVYRRGVEGSWTNKVQTKKTFLNHWIRSIEMLEGYDAYTLHKYSGAVKKRKSKIAYMALCKLGFPKNNDDIEIEKLFRSLNIKDKLKYRLKKYATKRKV